MHNSKKKNKKFTVKHFQNDLILIKRFLQNYSGDDMLTYGDIQKVNNKIENFWSSFHGLDIRQHSSVHENVVNEIISSIFPNFCYLNANEYEKCKMLKRLILTETIPFNKDSSNVSNLLKEVLGTFFIY